MCQDYCAEAAETLGNLGEERGLKEEALSFFATALERDATNPRRYVMLAVKAQQAGDYELSPETARRGLTDFPEHPILRRKVGSAGERALTVGAGRSTELKRQAVVFRNVSLHRTEVGHVH